MSTVSDAPAPATLNRQEVELLSGWLEDEITIQGRLLEALRSKEELLIRQDMQGLQQCLKDSFPIVNRIEELTHRRIRILRSLGRRLELDGEVSDLQAVLDRARGEDRRRLEEAHGRLREVLALIGRQNRRNQVLIRNGIELNRALVHTLFGDGLPGHTYDRSARTRERRPGRSFVDQEL